MFFFSLAVVATLVGLLFRSAEWGATVLTGTRASCGRDMLCLTHSMSSSHLIVELVVCTLDLSWCDSSDERPRSRLSGQVWSHVHFSYVIYFTAAGLTASFLAHASDLRHRAL